ncbi:MAG: InlB B-repeat-containing protein [Bacteroidota bacterium]
MSGCNNISLGNITTSGNAWGGVAVYTSGPLNVASSNINLDLTTSSLGVAPGTAPYYLQNTVTLVSTNVGGTGWTYRIWNNTDFPLIAPLADNLANALAAISTFPNPLHSALEKTNGTGWFVSLPLKIQVAVDFAAAGEQVEVAAGTFNERVTLNKSLTLQGTTEATTILDGTGLVGPGSGISITSGTAGVTIRDLTVQDYAGTSPNSYAGIYAVGGNNSLLIENVTLKDNVGGSGFYANGPVNGITLDNLDVSGHTNAFGAARGIVIWNGLKENITVTNSSVYNNNCCGIELQDGTASGVTIENNSVYNNGDNGIGVVGMQGPGENLIKGNTLTDNGRFGIEVKNPNGSGAATGPGRIVVDSNNVSRTLLIGAEVRDIVGIAAFRRGVLPANVDIPVGVVIKNNTVSGYVQSSTSDGFGIVAEGLSHTITGNNVSGCDVGIQRQAGHLPYPGDGDQSNLADMYFGRGNSPMSCAITVSGNTLSNTINTRDVGPNVSNGIVENLNTSEIFCSIQNAINDAQTLAGHTIEVGAGSFSEQVLVNKSVTIKGGSVPFPVVDFLGTVSGKPTLFDISADGVIVDSMRFNVDLAKLKSAIIASAVGLDNITVINNVVDAYGTPSGGLYGDRNAVSINYGGNTNYRVASGGVDNITFQGNSVDGDTTFFRSGVAVDEAGGTFSGNTLRTINHDVLVRFGSNGNINITGNFLNGGGVELADMNAGAGTLTVSNNDFDGAGANVSAPGTAVLRLKNNYNSKTTLVSGNTFVNHEWAVSLENYNTVTLDDNTFTPLASSTTYHHVVVNTKAITTISNAIVQVTIGAVLTNNTFNWSGTPGGTAVGFYNHDNDAASFGTLTIGTTGNENTFNNGIAHAVYLDNESGPSNGTAFPNYNLLIGVGAPAITTKAPWTTNMNAANNEFDVGSGATLPGAMVMADLFSLEDRILHKIDVGTNGVVTVIPNNLYVTLNSFFSPTTTTPEIQRGVDAASAGNIVNVSSGNFFNDVLVNKGITLKGQGIDVTTVSGLKTGPNGTTVRIATPAATVVEGFTITRDGNNVTDWPTNVKTAGLSIQGVNGVAEIRNNKITGNRSAIDINNSSGHIIRNNQIIFNRTGLIFRNQTDNITFEENEVTDNWTVGILFLDASGGTNVPVQTALNCTFTNNNLSGNWYGQIVERQSGGSLPAPGTNLKNFSGNWYGTITPAISTANSTEPGYAAQIPVAYGGGAVPPGGQPDILGTASANFDFTPWLNVGTDTDVENGFQGDYSTLWVDDTSAQTGTAGRIQEGVNMVSGSTVNVLPGTYREQIYINEPDLNLIGVAGSDSTFIVPPVAVMSQPFLPARSERPIIGVDSLGTNVVIDGFTVDGEGAGNTHLFMAGVQYFKGSGVIRNNTIKQIRSTPFSGAQMYIPILVNHDYPRNYAHAVEIHNDSVYDFGKTGIVANHPGTSGNIHNNVVIGQGPTGLNAQNGIQIGFEATGTIAYNTISNLSYTGASAASSMLLVGSSGTSDIHHNTVTNGQVGVYLSQDGSAGGTCSADIYANNISASLAGVGTADYYGMITYSLGGALAQKGMVRGQKYPAASPADPVTAQKDNGDASNFATMNVVLADNDFASTTPGTGYGAYLLATATSVQTVQGDSNAFSGYEVGVVTDKDAGAALTSTWRRNSFTGNEYGMYDLTSVLQDARENWWNSGSGPADPKSLPATPDYNNTGGLGDSVSAYVDYNPWYLDAPLTTLSVYTMTVNVVGTGTVTEDPDSATYLHGEAVTLVATPGIGYHFVGWTGDTTSVEDTIVVIMDEDKVITATFAINEYPINITISGTGSGTVGKLPDQPLYDHGTPVTLTANPAFGSTFIGWLGDTVTASNPINVVMNDTLDIEAIFSINVYSLNVVVVGSGSVSKNPDFPGYDHGMIIGLKATAAPGHHFVGWTGDTTTVSDTVALTITQNTNLTATFAINTYALNISISGSGTVLKSPDLPAYPHGSFVTLTAVPFAAWTFIGWTGDTTATDSVLVVEMTEVKNLTATFTGDEFLTITPDSLTLKGLTGRFLKPAKVRRDAYPNWINLLEETVVQGGFQPNATESDAAGGMRVGLSFISSVGPNKWRPIRDSSTIHGWLRLTKWKFARGVGAGYSAVQRTLEDKTGTHDDQPRGLDVIPRGSGSLFFLLIGEKRSLPPKRHNNPLLAEMIALKVNIAASQLGKTPAGLGELIFSQPGHIADGMPIRELSRFTDSLMTYWRGRAFSDYDSLHSAIYRINRAFPGPLDTISWKGSGQLMLNGAVSVGSVPFLQSSPAPPTILIRTTDETESDDEFDDEEFQDATGAPIAAKLYQNYPNPFNPSTTVTFALREPSLVSVRVYDMLGREVSTLLMEEDLDEGEHTAEFAADGLASGVYFYQIDARSVETGSLRTVATNKMVLMK